jgi:hypothetical protein
LWPPEEQEIGLGRGRVSPVLEYRPPGKGSRINGWSDGIREVFVSLLKYSSPAGKITIVTVLRPIFNDPGVTCAHIYHLEMSTVLF